MARSKRFRRHCTSALGITPEKAGDAVKKVLEAEAALRELAAQFNRLPG